MFWRGVRTCPFWGFNSTRAKYHGFKRRLFESDLPIITLPCKVTATGNCSPFFIVRDYENFKRRSDTGPVLGTIALQHYLSVVLSVFPPTLPPPYFLLNASVMCVYDCPSADAMDALNQNVVFLSNFSRWWSSLRRYSLGCCVNNLSLKSLSSRMVFLLRLHDRET